MLPCGQRARSRWSWRRRRTRGSTHVVRSAARAEPRRRARGAADESVDVFIEVPVGDPRFDEITRLDDLAAHWRREIETFFATYKELEQGKTAAIKGWRDADVAWRLIRESRARGAKAKR